MKQNINSSIFKRLKDFVLSWIESYEIYFDKKLMHDIRLSQEEIRNGNGILWIREKMY
jgi:hypothetical protein